MQLLNFMGYDLTQKYSHILQQQTSYKGFFSILKCTWNWNVPHISWLWVLNWDPQLQHSTSSCKVASILQGKSMVRPPWPTCKVWFQLCADALSEGAAAECNCESAQGIVPGSHSEGHPCLGEIKGWGTLRFSDKSKRHFPEGILKALLTLPEGTPQSSNSKGGGCLGASPLALLLSQQ